MSDLKAKAGDPIRAKDWNRIVDIVSASTIGSSAAIASMSRNLVPVLNDSGRDYDIGEFFTVSSYSGPADTDLYEVPASIEYVCDQPTWHTDIANLLVSAEPIPDGERGLAVVSGHCLIKVTNTTVGSCVMPDPATAYQGKVGSSGVASVMARPGDGLVIAILGDKQPLWRYKLTQASQAPSVTTAKLYTLGGTEFSTTEFNLSDPLSVGDTDSVDDEGYCVHAGNEFHIATGPC